MKRMYAGVAFIALGAGTMAYGAFTRQSNFIGSGAPLLAVGAVLLAAGRRAVRGERQPGLANDPGGRAP